VYSQPGRDRRPLGGSFGRLVVARLGRRLVDHPQMEQRRFDAEDVLGDHGGSTTGIALSVTG